MAEGAIKRRHEILVAVLAGVFAVVGGLVGAGLTIGFAGHVEAEKTAVNQARGALLDYVEKSWEDLRDTGKSQFAYTVAVSKIAIYAPKTVRSKGGR